MPKIKPKKISQYRDRFNRELTYINDELLRVAMCTAPTIINWIKNYEVDGKPIGFKRGGRWVVIIDQFNRFLRGEGRPKNLKIKKPPHVKRCPQKDSCSLAGFGGEVCLVCDSPGERHQNS